MQVQSAKPRPCLHDFLCLAVTALWYLEKKYSDISYRPLTGYD